MATDDNLPAYAEIERELLVYLARVGRVRPSDTYKPLADIFELSQQQRKLMRSDNAGSLWQNKVQWARKGLKDRGFLSSELRYWKLSPKGYQEAGLIDAPEYEEIDDGADEGAQRFRTHLLRERSTALIADFKSNLKTFECAVCNFDFEKRYGKLGKHFIEAHHVEPIGKREYGKRTKLADLVGVCANCHRMLHRAGLITIAHLIPVLIDQHP